MSPLLTHRRSRRRSRAGRLVVLACVLVVAAVVIGGVTRIGSQSGPYNTSMNRSFGVQGAVLVVFGTAAGILAAQIEIQHVFELVRGELFRRDRAGIEQGVG